MAGRYIRNAPILYRSPLILTSRPRLRRCLFPYVFLPLLLSLFFFQKDYAASVLAVLKRFGYDVESLNGAKVHSLFNIMTMEHNVHDSFDRLELWFERTVSV